MKEETRGLLDGERRPSGSSVEALEEAEAWERLFTVLREDVPGPAPVWLEGAVMAEVRTIRPSVVRRAATWLLRPSLSVSPLGLGLAAAAALVLLLGPWRSTPVPVGPPAVGPGQSVPSVVFVQFVLEAPAARSVAVAGDFNGWDGRHVLEDPDGDGIWTGRVPLQAGLHQYMFVVDGTDWVTDPTAERWTDDGFGNRNAVLAVALPGAA